MNQDKNSFQSLSPAEIYEQFYIPAIFRHWTPILLEFASPKPGEHIFDLACGTGIVARSTAALVSNQCRIVGLDINPGLLDVAWQRSISTAPFIEWQEGNTEDLPFPDNSFDLIPCKAGLIKPPTLP